MKKVIGILCFLLFAGKAFTASQVPDICIIKKDSVQDTLSVFVFPLEDYFELKGEKNLGGFKNCNSPSCSRGYQAVWLIENDSLFLINIQGCNEGMSWCDESALPSLEKIFGEECINNKVFAYWANGNYRFFLGDEIPHIDKQLFYTEKQVVLKNGIAKKIKSVQNVKPRKRAFSVKQTTPEFILYLVQTNLNWRALPKTKKDKWYAEMQITILKNGKSRLKLITDTPESFRLAAEKEYFKSIKNVRWYTYKQLGKKTEVTFTVKAYYEKNNQVITLIN